MSRRNRNRSPVLDQRAIDRMVEIAVARRFTPPKGANVQPISQSVLDQMQAMQAPQDGTSGMFSPGSPLKPVPGLTPAQGPRQFQYQIGYNIGSLPRSTELTSFDVLRNLASLYDGIGLAMQPWFDLCSKPELVIKPRPELTIDASGDPIEPEVLQARYGARIDRWKTFYAKPDKQRNTKAWMRMLLKDRLEIDAVAIFKHRDRSGGLYALELIDGATIKPLADERGMRPAPPYPAYQQFVYGVPGMLISSDQMIYLRETEQTSSFYGLSRVERIILRINQALRKENRDMATFTDGNIPAGTLEPPGDGTVDWTPEDLLAYQAMWDGLLAGNDAIKARIKVIPPGSKFNKTDPDDIMVAFDDFLYTVTFGMFGVPKTEIGFTEKSNRSTGETQEAMLYRRTMSPTMETIAALFTDIMVEEGETALIATWKGFEEPEDFKLKAEGWQILTAAGIQSTSQAAEGMGLKALVQTTPMVISPTLGPIFIEDVADPELRKAAVDAKKAGYYFSKDNPGGIQPNEQEPQQSSQGSKGPVAGKTAGHSPVAKGISGPHGTGGTTERASPESIQPAATHLDSDGSSAAARGEADRAYTQELRRWQDVALKCLEQGKAIRAFQSEIIPDPMQRSLVDALSEMGDPTSYDPMRREYVIDLFRKAKAAPLDSELIGAQPRLEYDAKLGIWEATDTDEQLQALRDQGVSRIQWNAHVSASGVCPVCKPNDGVIREVGERFPSGHRLPQVHGNCQCAVDPVKE